MPIGLELGLEQFSLLAITILIGYYGSQALSALQITNQYIFIITALIYSAAHACSTVIGKLQGGKEYHQAKMMGNFNIMIGILIGCISLVIFFFSSKPLAILFLDIIKPENQSLLNLLKYFFVLQGLALLFDALRHTSAGALRGYVDTKTAMYATILSSVIFISFGFAYLQIEPLLPVYGLFLIRALALCISSLILYFRWMNMSNRYHVKMNYL